MERHGKNRFGAEVLKTLAVISLNLGGCTQPPETPQEIPKEKWPIITIKPEFPPPIRSEEEYRKKIEQSWVMKEARALTREELAQENLTPEELPALLEELRFSFEEYEGGVILSFQGSFFEQGVVVRYKNGELPKELGARALQEIQKGLERGKNGARIPFLITPDDEGANVLCTFKASPSVLPGSHPFISDAQQDLFGYSAVIAYDICKNEHGTFQLIKQSLITFRASPPQQIITTVQDSKFPEHLKSKLLEELFFFVVFAASDHEIVGHPAAYPARGFDNTDNHSQNQKSFMNPGSARVTISGDRADKASESVTIEDEELPLLLSLSRESAPGDDIAYKTIRLKRILYNKLIRDKQKTVLESKTGSLTNDIWKKIPE